MDSITRDGCKLVLNEVYEGAIEGFLERGEQFFSVLPNPDSEKELSEHSPLFEPGEDDARDCNNVASSSAAERKN